MKSYAETTIRVRYAETDQMGVVYYGNYFTWFEVGRVELCRQLGRSSRRSYRQVFCFEGEARIVVRFSGYSVAL